MSSLSRSNTLTAEPPAREKRHSELSRCAAYSVNEDYLQNRPAILVVDQKVSPFFSLGSGPTGFEASFKNDVRNGFGIIKPLKTRPVSLFLLPSPLSAVLVSGAEATLRRFYTRA